MWIEQKQKKKYILAYLKLWVERRTGSNCFTGTAFRAVPAYFHLWVTVNDSKLILLYAVLTLLYEYIASLRHVFMSVVLHAHPVRSESHIQRQRRGLNIAEMLGLTCGYDWKWKRQVQWKLFSRKFR